MHSGTRLQIDIDPTRVVLSLCLACFESFRQDLGADKAGHCSAKSQVVALGEVDPIYPIGRHNFASVEKRNLKEPGQVAIVRLANSIVISRPPLNN